MSVPRYHLRLLGGSGIEVEHGDSAGLATRRHPLALAAILAVESGRAVARDKLVALLWPDADTETARKRLRVALHALRQALGPEAIVSAGDDLRLDATSPRCDLVEFRRALEAGRPEDAVEAYGGPLLDGFHLPESLEFDQWAEVHRERLARQYRGALEELAERCAAEGEWSTAVAWWRRRAEEEPSSSRVVVRLMETLERAGDRAAALREAERHTHLLREEFDAEPEPEVRALVERMRASPGIASIARQPPATGAADPKPASAPGAVPGPDPPIRQILPPTRHDRGEWLVVGVHWTRRRLAIAVAVTILLGIFAFEFIRPEWISNRAADVVAVAPIRVTAPDSAYNYLREGIVDVANGLWIGDGMPRAIDSGTLLRAWRRASGGADRDLPLAEALQLAARLGAGRLLVGEVVANRTDVTMNARLLRVRDGRLLDDYSERGAPGQELQVVERVLLAIAALSQNEAETRLHAFSDSPAAVKAYLRGMATYRAGGVYSARDAFSRALEIDSTFAVAALWRALVSPHLGLGAEAEASRAAWELKDRLGARDRLLVGALFSIGPNYPEPYTMSELVAAAERAAHAHPDRPEAWLTLGYYLQFGPQLNLADWPAQAGAAFDSAIALDSANAQALFFRLMTALRIRDTRAIRHYSHLIDATQSPMTPQWIGHIPTRWAAAQALGDSAAAVAFAGKLRELSDNDVYPMIAYSAWLGFSLEDAESKVTGRRAGAATRSVRVGNLTARLTVAAIRGRVLEVHALTDSLIALDADPASLIITLALVDPGYEAAARRAASALSARVDATTPARAGVSSTCYAELGKTLHRDTTTLHESIREMRAGLRDLDLSVYSGSARLGVCALLLEAIHEQTYDHGTQSTALDSLETLLQKGPALEPPEGLPHLMVARWREQRGHDRGALATVRRAFTPGSVSSFLMLPVLLREEGRLAALAGDTAGAIDAYQRYLAIRDDPDPGPMEGEVNTVRRHLLALTSKRNGMGS